ncbi:hypothetical protein AALP_AA2G136200 [Arabis alpina]|uniref:EF-hand domain-containing protein n=1 Tax=Arabis alpina TaxID=50452 RepID=A0A087HH78_ARAAL|nr:hypothetical protein AALP_AA2G136200 [Arabis alpina]
MASSISSASTGVKFVQEDNILQRHAAFFDRNNDGIIYPSETYQGLRAIGCGYVFSAVASVIINIGLSSKTRPGKGFSWSFPIEIKNIHLAKHGSDTDAYDKDGRFVASKFEEIFAKHAKTHPDALTNEELKQLLKANKEPNDPRGAFAACTEWKLLYHLCKDKNGLLHKDSMRAVYDGSIFEKLEKQRAS